LELLLHAPSNTAASMSDDTARIRITGRLRRGFPYYPSP
jgi:hypothetical protein